jgi:tRNA threonylcarbamoyladenosine biosynthesis protein TsaB
MRGLAIETSSRVGSVALVEDGVVVAEESFRYGLQHAALMVPAIDGICRSLGWAAEDIGEIYVSAGPGSFTGLRIGITLAKTLAFVTGAKIVAVPSALVVVQNVPVGAREAIVVMDAKRDQIFTAAFERCSGGEWEWREQAHLDSLAAMLSRAPRPVYLIGEGIGFHRKFIPLGDEGIVLCEEGLWTPTARVVAGLGFGMARRGEFVEAMKLSPIYIRKPEAEEKWEKARG